MCQGSVLLQVHKEKQEARRKLRERRVPSSPVGRAAGFAGLGASLLYGSMRDSVSCCAGGHTSPAAWPSSPVHLGVQDMVAGSFTPGCMPMAGHMPQRGTCRQSQV